MSWDYLNHNEEIKEEWPFSGPLPTVVHNYLAKEESEMKPDFVITWGGGAFSDWSTQRDAFLWLVWIDQCFCITSGKSLTLLDDVFCCPSTCFVNENFGICDYQDSFLLQILWPMVLLFVTFSLLTWFIMDDYSYESAVGEILTIHFQSQIEITKGSYWHAFLPTEIIKFLYIRQSVGHIVCFE